MRNRHQRLVEVWLQGGMGNQLFQIAAGIDSIGVSKARLRLRSNAEHPIVLACLKDLPKNVICQYKPYKFRHRVISLLAARLSPSLVTKSYRLFGYEFIFQTAREAFGPRGFGIGRGRRQIFAGYFQDRTWHENSRKTLLLGLTRKLKSLPAYSETQNSMVISLRRGDYVQLKWALPLKYYSDAIAMLGTIGSDCVVVSDDQLCAETFVSWLNQKGFAARTYENSIDPELIDLALIAGAERVIISNSTYCLWGVFAGRVVREDQVVAAPSPWLPNYEGNSLLFENWRIVDSGFAFQNQLTSS